MKNKLIFCCILVAVATVTTHGHNTTATDYCDVKCVFNGTERTHIRCNNGSFGPLCRGTPEVLPMTGSRKNLFLHGFNVIRNLIAGGYNSTFANFLPACRMGALQWDDGLAYNAVPNTKMCKSWFDYCHPTDTFNSSGQAIFATNQILPHTGDKTIKDAITVWKRKFLEKKFSDIAADRNTHVGCAITTAASNFKLKGQHLQAYWVTCNFSVDLQKGKSIMYEVCEKPAEKCENKPVAPYPNLCSAGETYE